MKSELFYTPISMLVEGLHVSGNISSIVVGISSILNSSMSIINCIAGSIDRILCTVWSKLIKDMQQNGLLKITTAVKTVWNEKNIKLKKYKINGKHVCSNLVFPFLIFFLE